MMGLGRSIKLGIDIGGTFTDLVAEDSSGKLWGVKVPTTASAPAQGALESVRRLLEGYHIDPKRVRTVVHATTLASNALLTGTLPKVALVTTEGFRDVLEIGRQNRPELYNLQVERIRPLVPRRYRFEISERVSYDGKVLQPLDIDQARRVARNIRRLGFRSVAVCFLHSYANPRHERRVAEILRREVPKVHISVSSDLLPEFREYERTSTTVVNACLQPIISEYLSSFQEGLASLGVRAPLFVMQSNSGTILSQQASREPARIIESGPVAGAVASKAYGKLVKAKEIISLDVGGTTSKAGVWSGERFDVTSEYEVGGRTHGVRRLEGSGYPVRFPYVDLVEVGTGGGSIAHVDEAGVLHVGPESAGSSPGPACYGIGGNRPTLTDANLVLGRLNSEYLLGGELKLDAKLAERAVRQHVAGPLKTGVPNAAIGFLRIAIANMTGALRTATIERGRDPRGMMLVAFGGAGPMHACEIAEQLEIPRVLVPPWAGLFSSMGLLLAKPLHDFVKTVLGPTDQADCDALTREFHSMENKGRTILRAEGIADKDVVFNRLFDLRYRGQSFELSVPVPRRLVDRGLIRYASRAFHQMHAQRYGYSNPHGEVELVNLRMYCRGRISPRRPKLGTHPGANRRVRPKSYRNVFLGGRFATKCPVFDRFELAPSSRGRGPCIVEDYDTTIVVPADVSYAVDRAGSFVMSLAPR